MSMPYPQDEYLSNEQLAELRQILVDQREALAAVAREAMGDLTKDKAPDADELDLAASEAEREYTLRLAEREKNMLHKVEGALHRIQQGEYGACETCGAEIGYARLKARPVATQCIDCKSQAERF
jgi:DnaK suppressor protein